VREVRAKALKEANTLGREMAVPPGGTPVRGMTPEAAMTDLMEQFNQAYAKVNGWPMQPVTGPGSSAATKTLDDAAIAAARSKNVGELPAKERLGVLKYLQEQLSGLAPDKNGYVRSDDLLDVRERIRAEVRDLMANGDDISVKKIRLYKEFLSDLSKGIEAQLPPDLAKYLKDVDAKYAAFAPQKAAQVAHNKTLGVGGEPTPAQTLRATQATMSPSDIAGGNYPFPSQQLARDAAEVLPTRMPQTGERVAALGPFAAGAATSAGAGGALGGLALGPAGAAGGAALGLRFPLWAANKMSTDPKLQRFLLGEAGFQQGLRQTLANPALQGAARTAQNLGGLGAATMSITGLPAWREKQKKSKKRDDTESED
jgi:hypothetical protein